MNGGKRSIGQRAKLLFVTNSAESFTQHRAAFLEGAASQGYEVHVAAPSTPGLHDLARRGLNVHSIPLSRRSINPFTELQCLLALRRLYLRIQPTIVHHVTIKAVAYGSLAGRLAGVPAQVNTMPGLGYAFTAVGLRPRLLKYVVKLLLKRAFRHPNSIVIFENPDDLETLVAEGVLQRSQGLVIKSVGVDVHDRAILAESPGPPVIAFVGRFLREKGLCEFVEAAQLLKNSGSNARFVLVGDIDEGNPSTLTRSQIARWTSLGVVEDWGWQRDMIPVYKEAHVVCLPSYREGVPRVLLEAAAHGRPVITTDAPGRREACEHKKTGLIVPPKDAITLANAIDLLAQDSSARIRMGRAGRALVEAEFAEAVVVERTLEVYSRLVTLET